MQVSSWVRVLLSFAAVAGLTMLALSSGHTLAQSAAPSLPTLGDAVSDDMDLRTERKLGDQVMREIRRDPDVLDDPLLLAYVQSLWTPLVKAARVKGDIGPDLDRALAFEAFLVRDRAINAFALPGGFMGVYLGLVAVSGTRDELAAVLAHELAHITQRHIARSIAANSRTSMVGAAAMLATIIAASRSNNVNPNAAQAAIVGGQALMAQAQLNFSRDMEREADRVGYGIFKQAQYAPAGVAALFEKLESANRLNDSGNFPYLRSHPLTTERLGDARARVDAEGSTKTVSANAQASTEHEWMRARARVLMDPRVESLRRLVQAPAALSPSAPAPERATTHYAAALAALALNEPRAALAALKASEAATAAPAATAASFVRVLLLQARAQALAATGQGPDALKLLDDQPDASRAALLLRATVAIDAARTAEPEAAKALLRPSAEALQSWLADQRSDPLAWQHLGRIHELQGLPLRALRAQAEAAYALGDVRGGIDRLRSAQRQAREGAPGMQDRIELAVIDNRVREWSAVYAELNPRARVQP
jgi:beta-barrel assembly-enhancing protease